MVLVCLWRIVSALFFKGRDGFFTVLLCVYFVKGGPGGLGRRLGVGGMVVVVVVVVVVVE